MPRATQKRAVSFISPSIEMVLGQGSRVEGKIEIEIEVEVQGEVESEDEGEVEVRGEGKGGVGGEFEGEGGSDSYLKCMTLTSSSFCVGTKMNFP